MLLGDEAVARAELYDDVVGDISDFLNARRLEANRAGIADDQIVFDPGIGFGKTAGHNLEILRRLGEFQRLGRPLLVGPSRKRFIGTVLGTDVNDRLEGTAAAVAAAVGGGREEEVGAEHSLEESPEVVILGKFLG